mgnify:CR=1 FL=1
MPTYNFRNKKTGEEFTSFMFMSEINQYLKDNPEIEQIINSFAGVGDPVMMGMKKPDGGFRDLLKTIKKGNRGSKINTW